MTYRMKQNSVGLASICILATMLLVTVSATTSFMFGRNEIIEQKYPYDLIVQANVSENINSVLTEDIRYEIEKNGMTAEREIACNYLPLAAFSDGNKINFHKSSNAKPLLLLFVTAQTYHEITGLQKQLGNDEIIISERNISYDYEKVSIFDTDYTVKEKVDSFVKDGFLANDLGAVADGVYIIVSDDTALSEIYRKYKAEYGEKTPSIQFSYGVNFKNNKEDFILTAHRPFYINLNSKEEEKVDASIQRIVETANAANELGGYSITYHAAFYLKEDKTTVFNKLIKRHEKIFEELQDNNIWVRPETTGKETQWGDIDEIIELSKFSQICSLVLIFHIFMHEVSANLTPMMNLQAFLKR